MIPGSGRSPGEGNGNPLQYSCLENSVDRGAWQATVHGIARVTHDLATKPPIGEEYLYEVNLGHTPGEPANVGKGLASTFPYLFWDLCLALLLPLEVLRLFQVLSLPLVFLHDSFCSVAQSCPSLCNPMSAACQVSLSVTNTRSLLKLTSIESVMPSNHLILCGPLLVLPPVFPSIRIFSNESALCIRWPKYWSFSFNISPSNEHPGLISFRMDWLDLFSVQVTLKSLLQYHSSKESIIRHSAFFIVLLSHPYMTRQTFVGKVMSLLFNMMSRLVITFLPRSKHLLISWLQSPSAVIFEPPKNKSQPLFLHIMILNKC